MQAARELAQLGQRVLELQRGAAQHRHRRVRARRAASPAPAAARRARPAAAARRRAGCARGAGARSRRPRGCGRESALSSARASRSPAPARRARRSPPGGCSASGPSAPTEATSTSPQVRPPATTGAATAERKPLRAHQLGRVAADVAVVLDPRGPAGARDDRGQPVAVGQRHGGADDEAAGVVLVGPAADRPRLPALVADRRRRAHVQQPPGLLGDGLEDRLGLGRGGDQRRDPPQRGLLLGQQRQRLVRAARRAPSRRGCPRARTACPEIGSRRSPPIRTRRGAPLPASSARTSAASGPSSSTRPACTPVVIVNAVLA